VERTVLRIVRWMLVASVVLFLAALVVDDAALALPYLLVAAPACVLASVLMGQGRVQRWLGGTEWKDLWPQGIAVGVALSILAAVYFVLSNT
jgi:hypothetical protein